MMRVRAFEKICVEETLSPRYGYGTGACAWHSVTLHSFGTAEGGKEKTAKKDFWQIAFPATRRLIIIREDPPPWFATHLGPYQYPFFPCFAVCDWWKKLTLTLIDADDSKLLGYRRGGLRLF